MDNQDINLLLENHSLKFEFTIRNLDLSQVFFPIPDNLERENKILRDLLDWVQRYSECADRTTMESEGYAFPPINPGISPENDWYRFEQWMQGKPIRQKLKEQLAPHYTSKSPEHLTDEEIIAELQTLSMYLTKIGVALDVLDDVPDRLVYDYLLEVLEDEFDIVTEGFWHLGGCTGYCPGCFQRPWCETGCQSCWLEDEEAGKMHLIDSVKNYVSAIPISLSILQKFQAEADREFKEFKQNQGEQDIFIDPLPFDFDDEDEIPF
ncbi:MAG: hypothetical protein KDJ65_29660 [Anaerolineae bacterium]|nr:hypothetical protein [Anaerolineae bacterium]